VLPRPERRYGSWTRRNILWRQSRASRAFERLQVWFSTSLARRGVHIPRPLLISLRNTFRRRGRLMLTLFTLTMGGGHLHRVFNVRVTLRDYIDSIGHYFLADVSWISPRTYACTRWKNTALQVPGVVAVEGWAYACREAITGDVANIPILAPPGQQPPGSPDQQAMGPACCNGDACKGQLPSAKTSLAKYAAAWPPARTILLKINGHEDDWMVVASQVRPTKMGRWRMVR